MPARARLPRVRSARIAGDESVRADNATNEDLAASQTASSACFPGRHGMGLSRRVAHNRTRQP